MKQKRVTFKVAKAIKIAGYPQYSGENYWWEEGSYLSEHTDPIVEIYKGDDYYDYRQNLYYAPSYIDVWLWLWREKRFKIDLDECGGVCSIYDTAILDYRINGDIYSVKYSDPEEAIIAAIDYLVDNDLIK